MSDQPGPPVSPEDEQTLLERLTPLFSDERKAQIEIKFRDLWLLISALQLATRAPHLDNNMRVLIIRLARQLSEPLRDHHPDAIPVIELGFHTEFDSPSPRDDD